MSDGLVEDTSVQMLNGGIEAAARDRLPEGWATLVQHLVGGVLLEAIRHNSVRACRIGICKRMWQIPRYHDTLTRDRCSIDVVDVDQLLQTDAAKSLTFGPVKGLYPIISWTGAPSPSRSLSFSQHRRQCCVENAVLKILC
jgi:hypothetical protein